MRPRSLGADFAADFAKALQLYEAKEAQQAMALFKKLLPQVSYRQRARVFYNLGVIAARAEQPWHALAHLRHSALLAPWLKQTRAALRHLHQKGIGPAWGYYDFFGLCWGWLRWRGREFFGLPRKMYKSVVAENLNALSQPSSMGNVLFSLPQGAWVVVRSAAPGLRMLQSAPLYVQVEFKGAKGWVPRASLL